MTVDKKPKKKKINPADYSLGAMIASKHKKYKSDGFDARNCISQLKKATPPRPANKQKEVNPESLKRHSDEAINTHEPASKHGQVPGQVPGQVNGQVNTGNGQVDGQVNGGNGQVDGQVNGGNGQVDGQVPGQVLDGQVPGHVHGQMDGQMPGQVPGHVHGQVDGQMPGQVGGHVPGQVDGQMPGQVGGHVPGQVDGQIHGQVVLIKSNDLNHLTSNQKRVFLYLATKEKFITSYPELSKETGISYGGTRHALRSLVREGVLTKPQQCRYKNKNGFKYRFTKKIDLSGHLSGDLSDDLSTIPPALIRQTDRFFINNLSVSEFWKSQGLTEKKILRWMNDCNLDYSEKDLYLQLQFGENEPKVRQAKSPVNYFRKCLMDGGLSRPEGFKLPEERRLENEARELAAAEALAKKAQEVKDKQKALADANAFRAMLDDKAMVADALKDIQEGHITPKLKLAINLYTSVGEINTRLENRLRIWFNAD